MIYKNDGEVVELVKRFETRTLPKNDWTHAAHLTVALFYARSCSEDVALNMMRDGIRRLNDAHGTINDDSSGYHETLTRFWMAAVMNFSTSNSMNTPLFEVANGLVSELNDAKLPLRFYSREVLFSTRARREFVASDLEASAENC